LILSNSGSTINMQFECGGCSVECL